MDVRIPKNLPQEKTPDQELETTLSQYEEKLKKVNLTPEQAADVVAAIFDNGVFEKKYLLFNKYSVVFRTRTTSDIDKVLEKINNVPNNNNVLVAQQLSKYHLAASLCEFKNVDLRSKSLEEKVKLIEAMPDAVFRALSKKLTEFDGMISAVLSEGAVENF